MVKNVPFRTIKSILLTLGMLVVSIIFVASIQPEVQLILQGPYDGIIEFKYVEN